MLVASPIANTQNADPSRSAAKPSALRLATLHFLDPGVLPVLAMALIVGGWSYGLKLSHYLNTGLTRASTTRMWLDHRNDAATAQIPQHRVEHKFLAPQLCVFGVPPLPHLSRRQLLAEPAPMHTAEFVSPLHPLRAPPISSLLA